MTRVRVAVLDYGSGNVRSAVRMLQRLGAQVELTVDPQAVLGAAGLFVPGVGNFHACVRGLRAVGGGRLIEQRLLQGRPVIGVCVGMQVLFDGSTEASTGGPEAGLGRWPGTVERLPADIVPHMGWSLVETARGSRLFAGVEDERFYFVHSYGVLHWGQPSDGSSVTLGPDLTWAQHGARFVAAVESGPLVATQFHPEKSGDAGAQLLQNWLTRL